MFGYLYNSLCSVALSSEHPNSASSYTLKFSVSSYAGFALHPLCKGLAPLCKATGALAPAPHAHRPRACISDSARQHGRVSAG
jgi:hypothetical protein